MDVGEQCEVDPFWVCKDGLTCENHVCKIPESGVCTVNPDKCAYGLECAGEDNEKKCMKAAGLGESCEYPYSFCSGAFKCDHADWKCKIPNCLLYTSPSPRDQRGSRMPSSA